MSSDLDPTIAVWLYPKNGLDEATLSEFTKPSESILLVARAYVINSGLPSVRTRIFAVTNSRVLCIGRGHGSARSIDIHHSSIKSVEATGAVGASVLTLRTGQGDVRFKLPKGSAQHIGQVLDSVRRRSHVPANGQLAAGINVSRNASEQSEVEDLRQVVEQLETDVARLQKQVDFLEQLMHQRIG